MEGSSEKNIPKERIEGNKNESNFLNNYKMPKILVIVNNNKLLELFLT